MVRFRRCSASVVHLLAVAAAVVAIVVVIWVDLATGLWQDTVILSGIAAGLLTFALTALFLDRLVARAEHRRWLPVTRLALADLLHTLADEEASEISRGQIVPRTFTTRDPFTPQDTDHLLAEVMTERQEISAVMSRWAGFLAASADVQELMGHISDIATHLDSIRDDALEFERRGGTAEGEALHRSIEHYHQALRSTVAELNALLARA